MKRSTILSVCVALTLAGTGRGDDSTKNAPRNRLVQGRVTDARGEPIAGATISFRSRESAGFLTDQATGKTASDGRYHVDLSKVEWGTTKLESLCLAPEFAYVLSPVEAGTGTAIADFTLEREPWRTTEIRLAESSGRPRAGVDVTFGIGDGIWSRAKTDADGRCSVTMAVGQPIKIDAKPPGARPVMIWLLNGQDDPKFITLPVLWPIRGRVRDASGRPLEGITVGRSVSIEAGKPKVHPHFYSKLVSTDREGHFEFAPTVLMRPRDVENRPNRYRWPGSICYVDRDLKRFAFGLIDLSAPIDPLDVTLADARPVRFRLAADSVPLSTETTGVLTVSLSPRQDLPDFRPQVLYQEIPRESLASGGHVEAHLPTGKYILSVECYQNAGRCIGQGEQAVDISDGKGPIDLRPLRIEPPPHQKLVGKRAAEIDATDLDTGRPVRLADFRGKVVVLDFWGYWCGPCTGSMPYLADLHQRFEGRPLAIVALHDQSVQSRADYDRRTAVAKKYSWSGHDLPFRVLLDRPDPAKPADRDPEGTGATCQRYDIRGFPTMFVIDQSGTLVAAVAHTDHEGLESLITKLIDQKSASPKNK